MNNQGWVGEMSTEETKIETVFGFEAGNPAGPTLTKRTTMSSRPYKWFNKMPWKVFKTAVTTTTVSNGSIVFSRVTEDSRWKENFQLKFTRK